MSCRGCNYVFRSYNGCDYCYSCQGTIHGYVCRHPAHGYYGHHVCYGGPGWAPGCGAGRDSSYEDWRQRTLSSASTSLLHPTLR